MALRRGFSPQRIRSKRSTGWAQGPGGEANTTVTSSSIQILGSGVVTILGKVTLIRTRGELSFALSAATAGANGFACAFGIAVLTTPAFSAGTGSIPGPITEMDWDGWLYHRFFNCLSNAPITNAASEDVDAMLPVAAAVRFEVDSKAMRKFDEDETIAAVFESVEIGTATGNLMFNSRMLFKLG